MENSTAAPKAKPRPKTTDDFASRLSALIERSGLSQVEIARRAGINRSALSKILAGLHQPAFATACALADALGVDIAKMR